MDEERGPTRGYIHHTVRHPAIWIMTTFLVVVAIAWARVRPGVLDQLGAPLDVTADLLNPGLTKHVIIISIDGLRPDAIARFKTTNLQRLMRGGRYTLRATTIIPPKTLPSHSSMLTGTPPSEHGITWNDDETEEHGFVKSPTIFGIARRRGLHTAAFFSKTKFEHLALPNDFDFLRRPAGGILSIPARQVAVSVDDYLADHAPNLLFVHLADVDFMGHRVGWMSYMYGRAARVADGVVGDILEHADKQFGCGNYTVIVTADHGGHGRNHGDNVPTDMLIPWIAWGEGVAGKGALQDSINTMDTAASALWLLGIQPPANMNGRVAREAFESLPTLDIPGPRKRPSPCFPL